MLIFSLDGKVLVNSLIIIIIMDLEMSRGKKKSFVLISYFEILF